MYYRRFVFLLLVLILGFLLIIPGVIFADDTNSETQLDNNYFRIEVSQDGFNGTVEDLRIEVGLGQEVEITFVYADTTSYDNQHTVFISGYNVDTGVLGKDNPEVTVKFIANQPGEFNIVCTSDCTGHENLQRGKLLVLLSSEPEILKTFTMTLDAPDQSETGQPLILVALIKDELNEPAVGYQIKFFVESDFFVSDKISNGTVLMEIGEEVTDERGLAIIDYIPNYAGVPRVVARYEVGIGLEPVEAEREIKITGDSKLLYQSLTGIQFPNSLLIWMMSIVAILLAGWGTFIFVLYQVRGISWGTGTKGISLIIMIIVAALFTILMLILITQEPQYNYNLFPS